MSQIRRVLSEEQEINNSSSLISIIDRTWSGCPIKGLIGKVSFQIIIVRSEEQEAIVGK